MKVCIVTGVTREQGLGFAISAAMVRQGYLVCIGGRDPAKLNALVPKIDPIGYGVTGFSLDVTRPESISKFLLAVMARHGRLDVLINNAATGYDAGVQPLNAVPEEVACILDTNLLGAWRMIQEAVPLLRKSSGPRIVNVSSAAGSFSDRALGIGRHSSNLPAYSISKLALNGLTVLFAAQLRGEGILVNAVDPGFVATYPGLKEMGARSPDDAAKGIVWAATLPSGGPSGKFFRDGEEIGW